MAEPYTPEDISELQKAATDSVDHIVKKIKEFSKSIDDSTDSVDQMTPATKKLLKQSKELGEEQLKNITNTFGVTESLGILSSASTKLSQSFSKLITINSSIYSATSRSFESADQFLKSIEEMSTYIRSIFKRDIEGVDQAKRRLPSFISDFLTVFTNLGRIAARSLLNSIQFQIGVGQKVIDSYEKIISAGANFGGSIRSFAHLARSTGVPFQILAEVTRANIDTISQLGLSVQTSAGLIGSSTLNIFKGGSKLNDQLVLMYGNFENLSEGVANWLSFLTQSGVVLSKSVVDEKIKSGALAEYLITQKELTSISGKTAKTLKAEEEERRKNLAYLTEMNNLSPVEQNNIRKAREMLPDSIKKFLDEMVQLKGELPLNEKFLRSAAEIPGLGELLRGIYETKGDEQAMMRAIAENTKQFGFARGEAAKAFSDIVALQSAVKSPDPIIQSIGEAFVSFEQYRTKMANAEQIAIENINARKKTLDDEGKVYLNSIRSNFAKQFKIDELALESVKDLDKLVIITNKMQMVIVEEQMRLAGFFKDVINKVSSAAEGIVPAIVKVIEKEANKLEPIFGSKESTKTPTPTPAAPAIPAAPTAPATPAEPAKTPRATGGIAAGPTLVGEDGTEAVIPLEKGPIPLNIDWRPLVSIMNQQVSNLEDIKGLLEDTQLIQKNILEATY